MCMICLKMIKKFCRISSLSSEIEKIQLARKISNGTRLYTKVLPKNGKTSKILFMIIGKRFIMYNTGEIVLVPFPFSDLSSSKTRPALVINAPEYKKATGNIVLAMVISIRYETQYDYSKCR